MPNLKYDFTGRTIIVTGAAQGIGHAFAQFFTANGAEVIMIDRDPGTLSLAAEALPEARTIVADVTNTAEVQAAVDKTLEATGRVDGLINNAGVLRDKMLWKLTDDDWATVLNVHAAGTFRFTRACVPIFRQQQYGRILNITSYTGLHGNVGQAAYATAKAGIIGFTKTAAKELARFGVTVNALSPNAETAMVQSMPPEKYEVIRQQIPMQRFGAASEMAAAAGFLLSEEAGYLTGAVIPVDGGLSI